MSTNQSSNGEAIKTAQTRHNRIFGAYALILVLTVFGTYLVWNSGNKVQEAIQADASARIQEAKQGVKKLEHDNLKLSDDVETEKGKVAGLQIAAADAKAAQQRVEIELDKQRERTANAERELLRLQASLADRSLSPKQHSLLIDRMRPWAGLNVDVLIWGEAAEIQIISGQILKSLTDAGWHIHAGQAGAGGAVRGILVGVRPDADAHTVLAARELVSALQSFGLASGIWEFNNMVPPAITFNSSYSGNAPIRLFIGSKPPN